MPQIKLNSEIHKVVIDRIDLKDRDKWNASFTELVLDSARKIISTSKPHTLLVPKMRSNSSTDNPLKYEDHGAFKNLYDLNHHEFNQKGIDTRRAMIREGILYSLVKDNFLIVQNGFLVPNNNK